MDMFPAILVDHFTIRTWFEKTTLGLGMGNKSVEIQAMKFFQITSSPICSMCLYDHRMVVDLQETVEGVV